MGYLGLDIGYSNLKIAASSENKKSVKTLVLPAGASKAENFGKRFDGQENDYIQVDVDGQTYIAGASWDKAVLAERALHRDYILTPEYKALFIASLLKSELDSIDVLVTGLPVSQFIDDKDKVAKLEEMMTGVHKVSPKRSVEVKKTIVVPQPLGGFMDYVSRSNLAEIEESRILVVDVGFFSVDWVLVDGGNIQKSSSGTSLNASSMVLEQCSKMMSLDYGTNITVESIENAIRIKKNHVKIFGKDVDFSEYISKAIELVTPSVINSIQKSIRAFGEPDQLLLVGGGSMFFEDALKKTFNRVSVHFNDNNVCSNAIGFLIIAES